MADDIADLEIQVNSRDVKTATSDLDRLAKSSGKAEAGAGKLTKAWDGAKLKAAAAGAIALTGAVIGLQQVISKTRQFQVLQAGLKTATGSVENATVAFEALKKIGAETPYDLAQVTGAFTKLVNYGLTPSREALMSYGDTASALGKSLEEMVEAVADAATGEFERLKEFGIKASKEGDKVTFTFRGIKTEVANTSEAIEGYLIKLGQNNFAGAMEDRMATLDGAISNLGDAWDQFLVSVGESGLGDIVAETIGVAITALQELTAYFESGQFEAGMEAWGVAAEGLKEAWSEVFSWLTTESQSTYDGFFEDSKSVWDDIIAYVQGVGPMFTAFVEEVAIRLWGIVDAIAAVGKQAYNQFKADMDALIALAKATGAAIGQALQGNFSSAWDNLATEANAIMAANTAAANKIGQEYRNQLATGSAVVASEIEAIYNKAGERLQRQEAARQQAIANREAYDAKQAAPVNGDPLAPFKVSAPSQAPTGGGGGGKKGGGAGKASEFDKLVEDLQREEDAIRESYERRLELVTNNTKAGSEIQAELSLKLTDQYEEEALKLADAKKRELDTMWEGFQMEEDALKESYERRREIILAATELTEEEKLAMLADAQEKYLDQMRKHNAEQNQVYLDAADEFFGNLASIGSTFGKKGFEIAKKAAIAQATIKMYESATSAYASLAGIPYVGPALGAVAAGAAIAAGAANIAQINAQTYQAPGGSYAQGGIVPGTSFSGDKVQANVNSGEMILNASQQRELFGLANGDRDGGKAMNVVVHNYAGAPVETKQSLDGKTLEVIVGRAVDKIASDVQKGGTKVSKAMEQTWKLRRGA